MTIQQSRNRIVAIENILNLPGYEWLTVDMLHELVRNSNLSVNEYGDEFAGNGLIECGAIIIINHRILIDLDAFDRWVNSKRATRDTESLDLEEALDLYRKSGELPSVKV